MIQTVLNECCTVTDHKMIRLSAGFYMDLASRFCEAGWRVGGPGELAVELEWQDALAEYSCLCSVRVSGGRIVGYRSLFWVGDRAVSADFNITELELCLTHIL